MISATSSRVLLKRYPRTFQWGNRQQIQSGIVQFTVPPMNTERREMHSSASRLSDTTAVETPVPVVAKTSTGVLAARFVSMAEVTISKIFPAGFGWQTASIVADQQFGLSSDTMGFALTTGVGDAIGVLGGHIAYYAAKKSLLKSDINLVSELHTGVLLGSAAFCSGTAWQPIVNALQGANLSFMSVFAGTWIGCGMAFYAGLRMGRTILSGPLQYISEPTYDNSRTDASLSMVIGGATGFFVGTDAAYLPDQNFLINIVGIKPGTPNLVGCAIAGSSTSLGFMTAQSGFNFIFPAGKCWND